MGASPWLVSKKFDLWFFLFPAVLSLGLVLAAPALAPQGEVSLVFWLLTVVVVDVAHVWSTLFRTYFVRSAWREHWKLLVLIPVSSYIFGFLLYDRSPQVFWRGLAYAAVFHFVRQQYGWLRLYQRREVGLGTFDRRLEILLIYLTTCFPLLYWHAHLPRDFHWFVPGDFITSPVPNGAVFGAALVYSAVSVVFFARVLRGAFRGRRVPWGKINLIVTTALCWGIGIVGTNTDWAFTVTNVLIHGVPYLAFVWVSTGTRDAAPRFSWPFFLCLVCCLAFVEELLWDRLVYHERGGLFWLRAFFLEEARLRFLVPLLAVPQLSHYLLDGWIWRAKWSAEAPS